MLHFRTPIPFFQLLLYNSLIRIRTNSLAFGQGSVSFGNGRLDQLDQSTGGQYENFIYPAYDEDFTPFTYEADYSPVNPGPLDENTSNSFRSASYVMKVLPEDRVMYRNYGGTASKVGSFLTETPPGGALQAQIDLALVPSWGNNAKYVTKVVVPKGTIIYEGVAAPQNILTNSKNYILGTLPGGGNQVYIPNVKEGWFQ